MPTIKKKNQIIYKTIRMERTKTSASMSMFLNGSHSRTFVMQNADEGESSPIRRAK